MMNRLRRAGSRLSASRIGRLFARTVSVGWIVLVFTVWCILFGLISWSVRHNYQADKERDDQSRARTEYVDCLALNDRRADVKKIALAGVENDRFFIEFVDTFIPGGLDDAFKLPLFARYAQQVIDIEEAYKPEDCPPPPAPDQ